MEAYHVQLLPTHPSSACTFFRVSLLPSSVFTHFRQMYHRKSLDTSHRIPPIHIAHLPSASLHGLES